MKAVKPNPGDSAAVENPYFTRTIVPELSQKALYETDEDLQYLALLANRPIVRGCAPFIGRWLCMGTKMVVERQLPEITRLDVDVVWTDNGRCRALEKIVIGTVYHGPVLIWFADRGLWYNCYSPTATAGSEVICASDGWSTLGAALEHRNFCPDDRPAFTEGPALSAALQAAAVCE